MQSVTSIHNQRANMQFFLFCRLTANVFVASDFYIILFVLRLCLGAKRGDKPTLKTVFYTFIREFRVDLQII